MVRLQPRWHAARELVRAGRIGDLRGFIGTFGYSLGGAHRHPLPGDDGGRRPLRHRLLSGDDEPLLLRGRAGRRAGAFGALRPRRRRRADERGAGVPARASDAHLRHGARARCSARCCSGAPGTSTSPSPGPRPSDRPSELTLETSASLERPNAAATGVRGRRSVRAAGRRVRARGGRRRTGAGAARGLGEEHGGARGAGPIEQERPLGNPRSLTAGRSSAAAAVGAVAAAAMSAMAGCQRGAAPAPAPTAAAPARVTISLVGTNDLHGHLEALPAFGGYLANLRRARARDGGAVVARRRGRHVPGDAPLQPRRGGGGRARLQCPRLCRRRARQPRVRLRPGRPGGDRQEAPGRSARGAARAGGRGDVPLPRRQPDRDRHRRAACLEERRARRSSRRGRRQARDPRRRHRQHAAHHAGRQLRRSGRQAARPGDRQRRRRSPPPGRDRRPRGRARRQRLQALRRPRARRFVRGRR